MFEDEEQQMINESKEYISSVTTDNGPELFAVITNLPAKTDADEVKNFFSKRNVPMEAFTVNIGRYAIIETDDGSAFDNIGDLIGAGSVLGGNACELFGNSQLFDSLMRQCGSGENRRVVVVKNISIKSNVETVIEMLPNKDAIVKHSFSKIHFGGAMSKMLTIEFNTEVDADCAIETLKGVCLDDNTFQLEYQLSNIYDNGKIDDKVMDNRLLDKTKLVITNLPYACQIGDIEKIVKNSDGIKFPKKPTGRSRGFCMISFKDEESAAKVMHELRDRVIDGRKIRCSYSSKLRNVKSVNESEDSKNHKPKTKRKFVMTLFNLPVSVKVPDIKEQFEQIEKVLLVSKGDKFTGIAEVHFKNAESLKKAFDAPAFSIRGRSVRKELKGGKWR